MIFAVDGRSDSGHDLGFDSDPVDEAWRWDAVAASVFRQERNAGCDCIARLCCLSWVRLSHPISDLGRTVVSAWTAEVGTIIVAVR